MPRHGRLTAAATFEQLYDPAVSSYWGVVIAQSCGDRGVGDGLMALAHRRVGAWDVVLADVPEADLGRTVAELRRRMIPADDDCWYAHFFRDDQLVVVFQDRVFVATTEPTSWTDVIAHGRRHGIPEAQLDFEPRTRAAARRWFSLQRTD
ncbi:hypothetical protein ACGIF2_01035 [Cellulomonas sp. P22]|uniref:hypothetical protein n=1 Tax=Cellulomonas sp. P22 TaxID=3373189 RepID=UPI00378BC126